MRSAVPGEQSDASTHLAIGRALQALDYDNLLVIGSGFSFHNMRAFFSAETPEIRARNQAFENWLEETCGDATLQESERAERLAHWDRAPHARFCHPREEHLLPLHVCYGLANKPSDTHISATILGKNPGWSIGELKQPVALLWKLARNSKDML